MAGLSVVVLAACSGPPSSSELDELLLQAQEVPDGLVLNEEASGPVEDLEEAFVLEGEVGREAEEGFVRGRERTYVAAPEAVSAGAPGFVGSLALLFASPEDAGEFMDFSRQFQLGREAPKSEELPADGLGEDGYGVHYPPDRRGGESFGYVWRAGDLVMVVAAGGPAGSLTEERVLQLAETVDRRAP